MLSNNDILKKLRVALSLRNDDIIEILFDAFDGELRWCSRLRSETEIANGKRPCHSERQYKPEGDKTRHGLIIAPWQGGPFLRRTPFEFLFAEERPVVEQMEAIFRDSEPHRSRDQQ